METLKPLKITCTSSDCDNDLHCFTRSKNKSTVGSNGACCSCGAQLVDWKRLHKRQPADTAYTFKSLRCELVRHFFWHIEIDQKAINYARRKGRLGMQAAAMKRIYKSIGPARPAFDGRQTPWAGSGNPLHYAQHAIAACCRKCAEYWHGIPTGRDLTNEEVAYLSDLVMLYINERLPQLTEDGEKIPRRRAY